MRVVPVSRVALVALVVALVAAVLGGAASERVDARAAQVERDLMGVAAGAPNAAALAADEALAVQEAPRFYAMASEGDATVLLAEVRSLGLVRCVVVRRVGAAAPTSSVRRRQCPSGTPVTAGRDAIRPAP